MTLDRKRFDLSKVKSKNTKPEKAVRSFLFSHGFRYNIHVKSLPGKPDIVFPKKKIVIFVNGCFWHQHDGCKRASIPKSNTDYWYPKLQKNKENDTKHICELQESGWYVITVWECQVSDFSVLQNILIDINNHSII